jgi:hypothetical protein
MPRKYCVFCKEKKKNVKDQDCQVNVDEGHVFMEAADRHDPALTQKEEELASAMAGKEISDDDDDEEKPEKTKKRKAADVAAARSKKDLQTEAAGERQDERASQAEGKAFKQANAGAFNCGKCGKEYIYAKRLATHQEKCGVSGSGSASAGADPQLVKVLLELAEGQKAILEEMKKQRSEWNEWNEQQ